MRILINRSFLAFSALIFSAVSGAASGRLGQAGMIQSRASLWPASGGVSAGPVISGLSRPAQDPRPKTQDTRGMNQDPRLESGVWSLGSGRELSSPSVGRRFYEIAYELAKEIADSEQRIADSGQRTADSVERTEQSNLNAKRYTLNANKSEQAIAFLIAAMKLDGDTNDVRSLLIKLVCRDSPRPLGQERGSERDYSDFVYNLLVDYVDESADLGTARRAVAYLLQRRDSREERERLLVELLTAMGGKNVVLGSQLATSLGLLMAQKADWETAKSYLIQAYNSNRYNKLAFAKLAELMPEQVGPALHLEHFRLALRENPSDIEAALAFAQCAERLQLYETAEAAYEYCADLFTYLYPSEAFPARIYLPWAISSYNTQQNQSRCLEIAKRVRQDGRFDLLLEALAAKAAAKIGDGELATQIFRVAEEKARQPHPGLGGVSAQQFAWLYCFALPDPEKALYWANEAYVAGPDSAAAAAILAYSLVMNNQLKWAKPLVNNYQRNQIADLALAQIQLAEEQRDLAIETLRSVIAKDPGSLAAERAKEILAQQHEEYIPPVDPNVLSTALRNAFGRTLVPAFTPPEQRISVQFNILGNRFPYGSEFSGAVAIINNSPEPLVISDDGLFKGNIRIDAEISGDLNKKIPNLVSAKIRTVFLIEPGRSTTIPLPLVTGELRKTLLTHPQASLDIEFTLYLDPVTTQDGEITNRLTYLKPTKVQVKRPRIELTGEYLTIRFNSISKGQLGQKIKTAQLFIGLLAEQQVMSDRKLPYEFMYADWVPPLLRSALLHESGLLRNPADDQWVVKVHTLAEMLSLPLDDELIGAVAENLNNTNWSVRMMAIYLLAKSSDGKFDKVVDWMAKYDSNRVVRNMATALGRSVSQ